jgi:hypothetical protein
MEVKVEKKMAMKKKWSKVSSQKRLTDCRRMLVNVR